MKLETMIDKLPNTDKNVIIILSGGLDSTILLYLVKKKYNDKVIALTMDYNQRHNIELKKASTSCLKTNTPHRILPIRFFGDLVENVSAMVSDKVKTPNIKDVLGDPQPVTYVPYRNQLFLSLALSFAESNDAGHVFIGLQSHDLYGYWDTTPEFLERINKLSELNRLHQIKIEAPFVHLNKKEEILLGLELDVPFEDSHTCYNPDESGRSCAVCPSCAERIKNFMDAGIKDPIPYVRDINWRCESNY